MRKLLVLLLVPVAIVSVWFGTVSPALAATPLVPCSQSAKFQELKKNAPDTYYFKKPLDTYASTQYCGEDGLPHLDLGQSRLLDVLLPELLFIYIAGFIGWSGRAYLQAAAKTSNPEEKEIFIDLGLAIPSFIKGLLWPLLVVQELLSGQLTAKDSEIPVSPR